MERLQSPGPCTSCGFPLRRKKCVQASILDVTGWRSVNHVILRCRNAACDRREWQVGHNFYVPKRQRTMMVEWTGAQPMQFWFTSAQLGFTTAYLRQLSRRVALQHVSFESESRVHLLEAMAQGNADVVPANSKAKIFRGWILWRLVACLD